MKKLIVVFILLIVSLLTANAQLQSVDRPKSITGTSGQINYTDIPVFNTSKQDNKKLLLNTEDVKGKPWQFGRNITVNIDVKKKGLVYELDKGKLFLLAIKSETALSLNFNFNKYKVPKGATLHIYSRDRKQMLGAFTENNNQADEIFATSLLHTEEVILEYFEPYTATFSGVLIIDKVTHGYRNTSEFTKGFGDSGSCNLNVNCADGLPWADEIRSVCAIVTNNSAFCTGTLINNVEEDETPYLLTANHCYSNPSSWVFWFNWESQNCENSQKPSTSQQLSGAILKARSEISDFCLVQLNETPPSDYDVFYAGWDRSDTQPESQVCIHHPSGDIKKISFDDSPANSTDYIPNPYLNNSHWEVKRWDRSTTTEPGSSGSPLFDDNHRVIGQLHGGWAACDDFSEDYFGKLSFSWVGDGEEGGGLKDFLDPNNTGALYTDGFDPNQPKEAIDIQLLSILNPRELNYQTSFISPEVMIKNRGLEEITACSVHYTVGAFVSEAILWTGSLLPGTTAVINFPERNFDYGINQFKVFATLPNETESDESGANNSEELEFEVLQNIFFDSFENANGWDLYGEFEIGKPQVFKECCNPSVAFSGSQILGTDLSGLGDNLGNYEFNLVNREYEAISPRLNCKGYENVELHFVQIVGVEQSTYDHAFLEIDNGNGYELIWENDEKIVDGFWVRKRVDISKYANNRIVEIRFSIGSTDGGISFCGWNIDDFAITGAPYKYKGESALVYPNPNEGFFELAIPNNSGSGQVDIYNSIGQHILSKKIEVEQSGIVTVNCTGISTGFYLLKTKINNESFVSKLIIR